MKSAVNIFPRGLVVKLSTPALILALFLAALLIIPWTLGRLVCRREDT